MERIYAQKEKAIQEAQDLRIRLERTQAKIDQLGSNVENESEERELRQRAKNYQTDLENAKKEVAALEKQAKNKEKEQAKVDKLRFDLAAKEKERNTLDKRLNTTKCLDKLNEQEAQLQRQNEKDRAIIDEENTLPSEREAAEGRVAERQEELARLRTQIEERERALPLREDQRNLQKTRRDGDSNRSCWWSHDWCCLTNALKSMGKALGNGLKDIGQKTASLLQGLIGQIVSFLFKTAGQAIVFLAEHIWLLILAVVAFLVEGYVKKRH